MTQVVLVEITPWRVSDGVAVDVRLAGGGQSHRPYNQRGFTDWRSGIANIPRFSAAFGYSEQGWTGGAIPQAAPITFKPFDKALLATLVDDYLWTGASITVRSSDDALATPVYLMEMTGTIAGISVKDGAMTFVVTDLSGKLDKPHTTATFAGTGGLEGIVEAEGRLKRRSYGLVRNVEGYILDKATNVFEFGDPNVPLTTFLSVSDIGRAGTPLTVLAWQGTALATLTALKASTPTPGGAVVAPSIACVKWWTIPNGPLTADIQADVGAGSNKAPDLAARIVAAVGGPAFDATSFAAVLAARTVTTGLHVDSNETTASLLDRLLIPMSVVWAVDAGGLIRLSEVKLTSPVETLKGLTFERVETYRPAKSVRVGYRKNHRRHSDGEISAAILSTDIDDLGDLAVRDTVSLGTPQITRADGTTVVTEAAAITSLGVASAVTGQTSWATYSALTPTNVAGQVQNLNTSGNLTSLANVNDRRLTILRRDDGSTNLTEAMAITSPLGIASAIAGQGALATMASVGFGTAQATGFGSLAGLAFARLGLNIRRADATTTINDADAITNLGVASAVAGQGPWATEARSPTRLFNPGQNLLFNGGFSLGLTGWSQSAGNWVTIIDSRGNYAACTGAGGTTAYMTSLRPFVAFPGQTVTLQGELLGTMPSGANCYLDLAYYNHGNGAFVGGNVGPVWGVGSYSDNLRSGSVTVPSATDGSGALKCYARFIIESPSVAIGADTARIKRVKYELGSTFTPWSDEATDGARLDNSLGQIVGQTNLPPIASMNLRYKFTGVVTYATAAGSPATATITVGAGSMLLGDETISYNSMTANITGTNGTTVPYFLYLDDPTFAGGSKTLIATTAGNNLFASRNRVYIGQVEVVFPASGTGGGSGSPGGGGGATCVVCDTILPGFDRAGDVGVDDFLILADPATLEMRRGRVSQSNLARAECVRIVTASGWLDCSTTAPIGLSGGGECLSIDVLGCFVPVYVDGVWRSEVVTDVQPLGLRDVQHITCENTFFLAGGTDGAYFLHHNAKYVP